MENIKNYFTRTFSSLKIRNFKLYFIGQTISLVGSWMQTIAQDWLVLKLTGSGTQLGLISALQFLPILFFASWGGVIADRFDKRKILYYTQAALGLLALILGVVVALNAIQLWMVYVLALALGFTNALNNPTRQAFVFEMVGKDEIQNAVTLNSAQFNLARALGPAFAGILIATVGLALCFILNGLSFIAVLIALYMMRKSELSTPPPVPKTEGQVSEGFKYAFSTPELAVTLLVMAIIGTFAYEFSVSLPLFAKFTFNGDASSYAFLTASFGLGAVLGGFFTASRRQGQHNGLIKSALIFGAAMLILSLAPNLFLASVALLFVGAMSINLTSLANSTLQLKSKPEMRGRVLALWTTAILGSTPIGGPIIGFIGEHLTPRWALALGGAAAVFAAGLGAWYMERKKQPAPQI